MSIHKQENLYIDKEVSKLDKTNFEHNKTMYKLAGWCTDRGRANNTSLPIEQRIDFTDQQVIEKTNYDKSMDLYAVWVARDDSVSYGTLNIAVDNISYSDTYATITYTIDKIYKYDNGTIKNVQILSGTDKFYTGTNGGEVGKEDIATNSRSIEVFYTHSESGQTSKITITQSGYTPTYKIQYCNSSQGTIECYQSNKLVVPSIKDNVYTCTSTNKNFTLKAIPSKKSISTWVANKSCIYYKNPDNQLLHAADYPNSNNCGSWKTTTEDVYTFDSWSGGDITGNTNAQVNVTGSANNVQLYKATFNLKPLLQNTIIGSWKKSWTTYTEAKKVVQRTEYRHEWVPTCIHDLKRKAKSLTKYDHEGVIGHGYWSSVPYKYNVTKIEKLPVYNKNIYSDIVQLELDAPYTFVIQYDGVLTISGKYGTNVYGGSITGNVKGGFKILKCNDSLKNKDFESKGWKSSQKCFDDFLCFNNTFNQEDKSFEAKFNVRKGEIYQFTNVYCTAKKNIAVFVESMTLEESSISNETNSQYSNDIIIVDDLSDDSDKEKLLNLYDSTENKDIDKTIVAQKATKIKSYKSKTIEKTEILNNDNKQAIYQIQLNAGANYAKVYKLLIEDYDVIVDRTQKKYKVLKEICYQSGSTKDVICNVYIPVNKKIRITAKWIEADAYNNTITFEIKGVLFDKL